MKRFTALSTHQLRFLGRKLCKRPVQVGAVDELKHFKRPIYGILNIQESHMPGLHWIAILWEKNSNILEVFDSFGFGPSGYSDFIAKFAKNHGLKIKYNPNQYQSDYSVLCGYYSILFLRNRIRGITYENFLEVFTENLKSNDANVKTSFKLVKFPHVSNCKIACIKKCNMESDDYASVCVQKNKRCCKM